MDIIEKLNVLDALDALFNRYSNAKELRYFVPSQYVAKSRNKVKSRKMLTPRKMSDYVFTLEFLKMEVEAYCINPDSLRRAFDCALSRADSEFFDKIADYCRNSRFMYWLEYYGQLFALEHKDATDLPLPLEKMALPVLHTLAVDMRNYCRRYSMHFNSNQQGEQVKASQEQPAETITLPEELNTEQARKYFPRAVAVGFMSEQYEWLVNPAQLGYFCSKVFEQPRPITALELFFKVKNLAASITQASYVPKRADVIKWRAKQDKEIFFD